MLENLKNIFRVKEMRRKLLYVLWMILVIRIGSQLPVPGVDSDFFKDWFKQNTGDAFNFFDAFTGGSFTQMSIFALNITPYITSSIIMQLLTIAIPALEEMQRDGEEGRKKITAITRYVIRTSGSYSEHDLLQRIYSCCVSDSWFSNAYVDWRAYY